MIGWVDCSSGVSGDMWLGALVDVGVPPGLLFAAVEAVAPGAVRLRVEEVRRSGLRATRVHVDTTETEPPRRTWRDVRTLLEDGALDDGARDRALAAFAALARAEGTVHGIPPEEVHFHEVGALDAIADVVGAATGLSHLALDALHASPVAVGSGTVRAAHGRLPVPAPAVVELLRGVPSYGGPGDVELATPTGAALLVTGAAAFGAQPPMVVERQGVGAGGRDLPGHPNVLRLLVGEPAEAAAGVAAHGSPAGAVDALLLEANVDDLDPRLWPSVLAALLEAGAADAWLVPVLMKKGRPAHTLCVLVAADLAEAVRRVVFTETSTIGLRETAVRKRALERATATVDVGGHAVRVKQAVLDGRVVNAQPEYEDVAAAARASGRPPKEVLADAVAAARELGRAR